MLGNEVLLCFPLCFLFWSDFFFCLIVLSVWFLDVRAMSLSLTKSLIFGKRCFPGCFTFGVVSLFILFCFVLFSFFMKGLCQMSPYHK